MQLQRRLKREHQMLELLGREAAQHLGTDRGERDGNRRLLARPLEPREIGQPRVVAALAGGSARKAAKSRPAQCRSPLRDGNRSRIFRGELAEVVVADSPAQHRKGDLERVRDGRRRNCCGRSRDSPRGSTAQSPKGRAAPRRRTPCSSRSEATPLPEDQIRPRALRDQRGERGNVRVPLDERRQRAEARDGQRVELPDFLADLRSVIVDEYRAVACVAREMDFADAPLRKARDERARVDARGSSSSRTRC